MIWTFVSHTLPTTSWRCPSTCNDLWHNGRDCYGPQAGHLFPKNSSGTCKTLTAIMVTGSTNKCIISQVCYMFIMTLVSTPWSLASNLQKCTGPWASILLWMGMSRPNCNMLSQLCETGRGNDKSKMSQNDATFSLQQVIYWKLMYPLLTTTFLLDQCHQILAPVLAQGLLAAGIVQLFLRALAHSPCHYGGLDLPNFFTEQTITWIQQVLAMTHSLDTTTFLVCTCGEYMWLEADLAANSFVSPFCFKLW